MTTAELMDLFERTTESGEFLKFARIEAPRHPRPDVCAFLMLHDAVPGTRDMVSAAEHDEIFLDVSLDKLAAVATVEMVRDLVRCGVWCSNEYECLAMFA